MVKEKSFQYDNVRAIEPKVIYNLLRNVIGNEAQENVVIILLNNKLHITGLSTVSVGTIDASIVAPRDVFRSAILSNAAGIILAHNHPSGNCEPSDEDRELTKKIYEAGELLCIKVLDHVVIGDGEYYSFSQDKKYTARDVLTQV
jgi:DNA repair protein RadC